jgi:NTP pyrophosphatase (non-canonical NTP hydrolase)
MKDRRSELLVCLQEECAEVIQAASKQLRFGVDAKKQADLQTEIGDILGILKLLMNEGHLDPVALEVAAEAKIKKLAIYMTHKGQP